MTKFEIENSKPQEIALWKRTKLWELHHTNSSIIVVTLGEAIARMKYRQAVNTLSEALKKLEINFKTTVII